MKYLTLFVLQLLIIGLLNGQGIEWENGRWEEVLEKARLSEKLIFVDVYTNWCGPCLKMDKDIFPDREVGTFFNNKFLSIKIDAEDEGQGKSLARQYDVRAYPSLLFIDKEGTLISTFVGLRNEHELIDIGQQTVKLYKQYDFIQKVKSDIHHDYSEDDLRNILELSRIHQFEGKEYLDMKYLDHVTDITEEDLRNVIGEIDKVDISYLRRLAPLTTSLSYDEISLRKNSQDWISWKISTERAIYGLLDHYKNENDLSSFEECLEILKGLPGVKSRQIDNLYLNFYNQNNLDQYKTFASYLIEKYIIPTRPKDVKKGR